MSIKQLLGFANTTSSPLAGALTMWAIRDSQPDLFVKALIFRVNPSDVLRDFYRVQTSIGVNPVDGGEERMKMLGDETKVQNMWRDGCSGAACIYH